MQRSNNNNNNNNNNKFANVSFVLAYKKLIGDTCLGELRTLVLKWRHKIQTLKSQEL